MHNSARLLANGFDQSYTSSMTLPLSLRHSTLVTSLRHSAARAQNHEKGWPMVKHMAAAIVLVLVALGCGAARADDSHMMTKERLLPLLGKPDVIIIDVRTNYDWDHSKAKIKGAAREEGMKFGSWMKKYPKDKTIVLYCA